MTPAPEVTRRSWIRRTAAAAGVATGFLAALGGGTLLLGKGRRYYPTERSGVGSDFAPPELADAIRTAGNRAAWNPGWGTRLIRPPGALAEEEFLAACIRCYRCQDACEPGAIQFFPESAGRHYHTPYVDPSIRACTVCMLCTQVCPTPALRPMEKSERAEVRMASVELREDLCLSHKAKRIRDEQAMMMDLGREPTESEAPTERRGPCGECHMFCPRREHAIRLEPGAFLAPVIDEEKCIGCGLCEEICRVVVRGEPAIRVVPIRSRG